LFLYHIPCTITKNDYIISRVYKLEENINRIYVNDTMTADEFKFKMLNSKDIQEHNRWQALYMAKAKGFSAPKIADIIGISKYSVNKWVYNFNHFGEESVFSHSKGGNRTSFLSWQEEEELLSEIGKQAEKGLLVVVKTIKAEIEARIGRIVTKDYPYDLLHRHIWRRVVPRPKHPKQDAEKQEDFKKTPGIPGNRRDRFSTQRCKTHTGILPRRSPLWKSQYSCRMLGSQRSETDSFETVCKIIYICILSGESGKWRHLFYPGSQLRYRYYVVIHRELL